MRYGSDADLFGESPVPLRVLLLTVLGPPLLWLLHFSLGYFLVTLGCNLGQDRGTDLAVVISTLLLAAACAWIGWVAYRRWDAFRRHAAWDAALSEPGGRSGFLMALGLLEAGVFTLLILLEGVPPLLVPTCTS